MLNKKIIERMVKMTNVQIIESEKEIRGIDLEVNTLKGWNRKGKRVNKGEKAVFKTKIWMPKKEVKEKEDGTKEVERKFIMVPAAFFTEQQVG